MGGAAHLAGGLLVLAATLGVGTVQAADFGHARLVSASGAPLHITVQVLGLTSADQQSLSAQPAPAADWAQASLTPPVALDSLTVQVLPGLRPDSSRVLSIRSSQPFTGNLADLLLDIQTASGEQRYQVSLLASDPSRISPPPSGPSTHQAASAAGAAAAHSSGGRVPTGTIAVKRGDNLFRIARRHAVDGVTVYQLMMALQRANPQAFIHDNINLVRAGATLAVPSVEDMLSISDRAARRQFQLQTEAFNRLRGQQPGSTETPAVDQGATGSVSATPAEAPVADEPPGDRLQLSHSAQDASSDVQIAETHAVVDAESRVSQLQDNVQNLNKALQAQGEAARTAALDGAQAITDSIGKVADAISEASQEAAAQADSQLAATGAGAVADSSGPTADAAAQQTQPDSRSGSDGGPATAAVQPGAQASTAKTGDPAAMTGGFPASTAHEPAATTANGAPAAGQGAAPGGHSALAGTHGAAPAGGAAPDGGAAFGGSGVSGDEAISGHGATPDAADSAAQPGVAAGNSSDTAANGESMASAADGSGPASGSGSAAAGQPAADASARIPGSGPGVASSFSGPSAAAEAAELQAAQQTKQRVSWIQEHLLWVMGGALAIIVFLIAWLLRRANRTDDEFGVDPAVTEAMVRERLQGVDLDLPTQDSSKPKSGF